MPSKIKQYFNYTITANSYMPLKLYNRKHTDSTVWRALLFEVIEKVLSNGGWFRSRSYHNLPAVSENAASFTLFHSLG